MAPKAANDPAATAAEYAKDAKDAATKLIEKRRQILKTIASGDLSVVKELGDIADAIDIAANASVWETHH